MAADLRLIYSLLLGLQARKKLTDARAGLRAISSQQQALHAVSCHQPSAVNPLPCPGAAHGNRSEHDWSAGKDVLQGGDGAHGKSSAADRKACVICMEAGLQVLFKFCLHATVCQACSALCVVRTTMSAPCADAMRSDGSCSGN